MKPSPDLVCVGHVVRETIYFPDRTEGPFLGSPPAYCAVAAARQGTPTGIVTKIGPDMPQALLTPLRESGVDTSGIVLGNRTTVSELIYDEQGHKEIRYPTKADPIRAEDVPAGYHGCRIIYVCTMDHDVWPEDLAGIVGLGQLSAVDLGGYGGVHMSKSRREAAGSLADLGVRVSRHFQIVKASDEDAESIFGFDDPKKAAKKLFDQGPEVVVITLGQKGSLVQTKKEQTLVPPAPGKAIDTTGGGDTFMAGFLSEYLRYGDAVRAARWGSATAICVIEKTGGVLTYRMPDQGQIRKRLTF